MILQNRSILRYGAMAMLTAAFGVPAVAAHSQARASRLDDPTIVAIFDAANTYDMETGLLAVSKGRTKDVRVAKAHRDRAQSLLDQQK